MWLTRLAITRPVLIWMALAAIALLGIVAYTRLPAELNPNVDIPTLTVTTIYPGAGPEEIETLVTRPLEDAVGAVNNVKDVFSSSQDSVSILSLDFDIGTNLDRAATAVREKVEAARELLPAEAHAPIVARLDINAQPVLYYGFSSNAPIRQLRQAIDTKLKPRLARVPGVATVTVVGGEQREIRVAVDVNRLKQYGLTVEDVASSIKAANRNIPAGAIDQGPREIAVRTMGAFGSLDEIRRTQILAPQLMAGNPPDGARGRRGDAATAPLTVGDLARVLDTTARPETLARVNGRESIGLIITKVADANTVQVVQDAKAAVESFKYVLPPETNIVISRDDSIVVRDALEDVNMTLVLGALLAMAVVLLFLHNLRGTIIVSIALPACLVATFLALFFAGFTLNQMTLLALSLSVGILIDDSIVVLESITRHMAQGEPPEEAAFNGRTEIGFADITTTLADVVVFLPIAFMGGIVGAFFRQFGMTIVVSTLFSLVVSFTVTPSLAAHWYREGENPEEARGGFERWERMVEAVRRLYRRVLGWALGHRGWVVAITATALVAALLVTTPTLGFELLPATDQGQVLVTVELPPDASLGATDDMTREIERRIAGTPDVDNYVTTVGELLGGFGTIPQRGPQYAQLNVRLFERQGLLQRALDFRGGNREPIRSRDDEAVAQDIRRRLQRLPGARITVSTLRSVQNIGPPIQIQLRGSDLDELGRAANNLRETLATTPGVLDPDVTLRTGRPELQVRIDRARAAALGIPVSQIGVAVRDAIEGDAEATYREAGAEYPIRTQLAAIDRNDPGDLSRIPVGSSGGRVVTLAEVAAIAPGQGPSEIDRVNGQRMVTVTANLAPGYALGNVQADVQKRTPDLSESGVQVHWSGESEALAENIPYIGLALGLAVILSYLVMASLFNSLLDPFVIMFTLPMALVGALGALAITRESISLVAGIGIIMLTGLMGRNAILLIDYTSTLRARGMNRQDAVCEAGSTRLRPILMTTLATIFGMLPVALRIGRASELRAPMAIVVIGGLLVSSLLTLVVIPVVYTLFDDLRARIQAGRQGDKEARR